MIAANGNGAIAMINGEAERLFCDWREEWLGQRVDILVPDQLRGPARPPARRIYVPCRHAELGGIRTSNSSLAPDRSHNCLDKLDDAARLARVCRPFVHAVDAALSTLRTFNRRNDTCGAAILCELL